MSFYATLIREGPTANPGVSLLLPQQATPSDLNSVVQREEGCDDFAFYIELADGSKVLLEELCSVQDLIEPQHKDWREVRWRLFYSPKFLPPKERSQVKLPDWISCLDYENGKILAGSYDGCTRACSLEEPSISVCGRKEKSPIKSICCMPEEAFATGYLDGSVKVSGKGGMLAVHASAVSAIAGVGPEGLLVAGSWNGSLKIVKGGGAVDLGAIGAKVSALHPIQAARVLCASWDCKLREWDIETKAVASTLQSEHPFCCSSIQSQHTLISGDSGCKIRMWDLRTGRQCKTFNSPHSQWVTGISSSPLSRFASVSPDGQLGLWDARSESRPYHLAKVDERLTCVRWCEENKVAFGGETGNLRVYDS